MKLPSPDQVLGNKNTLPSPSDVLGTVKKKVASQEDLWGLNSQPQDLYTSLVTGAQEPQQESDGLGGPPKMKTFTGLTPEEQQTLQAKPAIKVPKSVELTSKRLKLQNELSKTKVTPENQAEISRKTDELSSIVKEQDKIGKTRLSELEQQFKSSKDENSANAEAEERLNNLITNTGIWNNVKSTSIDVYNSVVDELSALTDEVGIKELKADTDPLSEEKNKVIKDALKKKIRLDENQINEEAKKLYKEKQVESIETDRINSFLDNLDDEDKNLLKQDRYNRSVHLQEDNVKQEKIINAYEVVGNKKIKEYQDIENELLKFKSQNKEFPKELYDSYINLGFEIKGISNNISKRQKLLQKNKEDLGDVNQEFDFFKRQYGDVENFLLNTGTMARKLAVNTLGGLNYVGSLGGLIGDKNLGVQKDVIRINAEIDDQRDRLRKSVETIESPEGFVNYVSDVMSNQIPSLVVTSTGAGGLAAIGVSTAGEKYADMNKEVLEGKATYSPLQMASVPFLYGAAEVVSEIPTLSILKKGGRLLESITKNEADLITKSVKQKAKEWAKDWSVDTGKEIAGEEFTNFAQNFTDKYVLGKKDVGLLDNAGTVLKDTFTLTSILKAAPHVAGAILKPHQTNEDLLILDENSRKIIEFSNQIDSNVLSDKEKAVVTKQMNKLVAKNSEIIANTIDKVDNMPVDVYKKVIELNDKAANIKSEAVTINDGVLPNKNDLLKELSVEYKSVRDQRNALLNIKYQAPERVVEEPANEVSDIIKNNVDTGLGISKSYSNIEEVPEFLRNLAKPTLKGTKKIGLFGKEESVQMYNVLATAEEIQKAYDEFYEKAKPAVEEVVVEEPVVEEVKPTEIKPSGQKVTDVINRPATLESQAGVKLETPIEGDVYQEGQRVIFEDKNKKIYDLGNIDEISDKTVEELGIKPQEEMVSVTPEGKVKVGENEWNMQSELPNYGIEYDNNGNVKAVSLRDDAGKTVMYEGQVAEDAAYQVLLKQTETPEQRQAINEILENDEELNRQLREAEEAAKAAAAEVTEPGAPKTQAEQYSEELDKTKESDPGAYWSVSPVSAADAAKGTIIDTPDGAAIVKPDGDIAGLFKKATSKAKGVAQDLLKRAIAAGGKKLDNYDTYLTPQYIKAGFRVVSRTPFNEEHSPPGWNKELHGTPDVVAMIYDPENKLDIEEKTFNDPNTGYDEAIAYRDSLLEPSIDVELEGLAKLFDESDKGFRESQVDNAKEALKGILPGVEFIVHETNEDYKKATGESGSGGMYIYRAGVLPSRIIHINKQKSNGRTVAHEVFHAVILDKIKGDKAVQEITARMVDAVYKTASPDLRAKLDAFAARYSDKTIRDEERLSELIGIIANGYPQMSQINKGIVERWLESLAKMFGLKPFTDNEVIDLLNTLARKISTGEVISAEDVSILSEKEINIPGSQIIGSINIKFRRQAKVADFDTTPPKVEGVSMIYPSKSDIKDVLEKSGGTAVFINSDGTKVGKVSINGRDIIVQGGIDYTFIKENVDDNIGFAASEDSKISYLKSISEELIKERDSKNPQHKGKPIAVFVVAQNGETMLGEWYAAEYIMEGIDQSISKNETVLDDIKKDFIEAIESAKLSGNKSGLADRKAKDKVLKMIEEGKFDTHKGRIEIAKEMASKDFSFGFRVNLNKELIAGNEKSWNSGKNRGIKKALSDVGHTMNDFWNKFLDERFLNKLNNTKLQANKGSSISNKTFSGFFYNPSDLLEDQVNHAKLGIDHAQFNSSFKSQENFLLDSAYDVNKLFPNMGYPTQSGIDLYNSKNKTDFNKKNMSITDKTKVSTWLNNNNSSKLVVNPYSSISLSIYTGTVNEEPNIEKEDKTIIRKQIVGENANLSQNVRDNLDVARDMESSNKSDKEIRLATGWERGADKKWRYEVPDFKFKKVLLGKYDTETPLKNVIETALTGGLEQYNLEKILSNNELFNLYPDLKKVSLAITNSYKSGFQQMLPKNVDAAVFTDYGVKIIAVKPTKNIELLEATIAHEIQHIIQEKEGFAIGADFNIAGEEKYIKSTGEVESRNVEKRISMTPEERRKTTLQETEDVAREDQIIFFKRSQEVTKKLQQTNDINEIVRIAKEAKYSDAAITAFLKTKGFSDVQIANALSTDRPSVNKIYEDSKKAIEDKKKRTSIKDLAPFLRKSILDRQTYIKKVINRIDNKSAKKAYDLLVTKAGASALAAERFKRAEKKIYGGLNAEDTSTLDKIIYAKRMVSVNESRAKLGLEPYKGMDGYSIDDANKDLADFKNSLGDKKFNDLSNRATEYFDVFKLNLKKLYESGRISKETYESLKDTEYSPIKTIKYIIGDNLSVDEIDTQAKSLGISRNDIMKLSDSNENEIIMDSKWLLAMSINSVEGRAFENNMLREFDKAIKNATPEEKKAFEDIILDNPVVGTKKDGGLKYKYDDTRLPVGFAKVSYFNDGNKVEMILKDQYAKQLLDVKDKNKALETLGKLTGTKILRFFATGGNPLFIIGNTAVDFQNIAFFSDVYSKFKPVATVQLARDYTKNFVKKLVTSNEYNTIFNEYLNHGGALDYMASDGLRSLESMNPVKGVTKAVQKGLIAYGRAMSLLGETSEVAFRLSVFQKVKEDSIKEFKKENNREPNEQELDDIMWDAARQSRETMPFDQGGDIAKKVDAVFPYFNAALQGIRRPIDFAKRDPVGFSSSVLQYTVMASSLAAASFAMLISAVGGDDDEEKAKKIMEAMNSLSEYEKANYHIMFTGEKNKDGEYKYYRIKKLPVLSVISTVAEQLIYKAFFKSKGIEYDMDSKVMLEAVSKSNPLPVTVMEVAAKNPIASGLISYAFNTDTFTGDKIFREPDNKKILPEAEGMFDDRVDQIYKDLAPGFGLSPARTKVMVEKVITSANTNPTIPLIYSAYDGLFNKNDGLGSEVKEAMSNVGDAFGKKVVRYTDKKIIRYKDQDKREYQESLIETKVWNSEQKVYNEIKKKYDGGGSLTNKELIDLVKENFEPMDYMKYAKKYNTYIHNMNIDKSVLDIIFEDVPEVQAMKLNQRYGPNLESEELKELGKAMNSAGKRVNNKSIYIYNKKYKNRKNAQ